MVREGILTTAQSHFASDRSAEPGVVSALGDGSVFMYRRDPLGMSRWLIDVRGRIVDEARFGHSAWRNGGVRVAVH